MNVLIYTSCLCSTVFSCFMRYDWMFCFIVLTFWTIFEGFVFLLFSKLCTIHPSPALQLFAVSFLGLHSKCVQIAIAAFSWCLNVLCPIQLHVFRLSVLFPSMSSTVIEYFGSCSDACGLLNSFVSCCWIVLELNCVWMLWFFIFGGVLFQNVRLLCNLSCVAELCLNWVVFGCFDSCFVSGVLFECWAFLVPWFELCSSVLFCFLVQLFGVVARIIVYNFVVLHICLLFCNLIVFSRVTFKLFSCRRCSWSFLFLVHYPGFGKKGFLSLSKCQCYVRISFLFLLFESIASCFVPMQSCVLMLCFHFCFEDYLCF